MLINTVFGTSFATTNREDLVAIFIPDVLRVNTATGPVRLAGQAGFSRLGFLGGDTTSGVSGGWPNGRRLGDDVVDIALTAVASGPTLRRDHRRRRQHQRQRPGLQPGLPVLGHAARRADEPQGSLGDASSDARVPLALALALGVAPSARAAGHGPARPAPDQPAVDQAIERLTAEDPAAPASNPTGWTALGDAFMQKARETADAQLLPPRRAARSSEPERSTLTTSPRPSVSLGARRPARVREVDRMGEASALELDAGNAGAYGLLGDAAMELGDYDAAARALPADARPPSGHLVLQPERSPAVRHRRRAASRLAHGPGDQGRQRRYAENTAWCRAQLALMHLDTGNRAGRRAARRSRRSA